MASYSNWLLASLFVEELRLIEPNLAPVRLVPDQILHEVGSKVTHVYFIEHGVAGVVAEISNGQGQLGIGLLGKECVVGINNIASPDTIVSNRVVVRSSGEAYRLPKEVLLRAIDEGDRLKGLISDNHQIFLAQILQTAVCNAHHHVQARVARLLLMLHDRIGGRLAFTQVALAQMLAIRRPAIMLALNSLERSGVILQQHVCIDVVDRSGLEAASCICYAQLRGFTADLRGKRPLAFRWAPLAVDRAGAWKSASQH